MKEDNNKNNKVVFEILSAILIYSATLLAFIIFLGLTSKLTVPIVSTLFSMVVVVNLVGVVITGRRLGMWKGKARVKETCRPDRDMDTCLRWVGVGVFGISLTVVFGVVALVVFTMSVIIRLSEGISDYVKLFTEVARDFINVYKT